MESTAADVKVAMPPDFKESKPEAHDQSNLPHRRSSLPLYLHQDQPSLPYRQLSLPLHSHDVRQRDSGVLGDPDMPVSSVCCMSLCGTAPNIRGFLLASESVASSSSVYLLLTACEFVAMMVYLGLSFAPDTWYDVDPSQPCDQPLRQWCLVTALFNLVFFILSCMRRSQAQAEQTDAFAPFDQEGGSVEAGVRKEMSRIRDDATIVKSGGYVSQQMRAMMVTTLWLAWLICGIYWVILGSRTGSHCGGIALEFLQVYATLYCITFVVAFSCAGAILLVSLKAVAQHKFKERRKSQKFHNQKSPVESQSAPSGLVYNENYGHNR